MPGPRNVLFVEAPWARFGSSISMLGLIQTLDRDRYRPHVAVHADNDLIADLEQAGIPHLPLRIDEWAARRPAARPAGDGATDTPTPSLTRAGRQGLKVQAAVTARVLRDYIQYRHVIRTLKSAIADWDIDLLHLNNQPSTNRFGYLAASRDLPIVQHVRDAPLSDTPHLRHLGRRTDQFICISQFVAGWVRACYDPGAPVAVVSNPVAGSFLEPMTGGRLRDMLGLTPDDIVFAQLGRIIPWKGQDIFVQAFIEALERLGPGMRRPKCVLIGSSVYGDELKNRLEATIRERGLQDTVFMAPYDNDVRALLIDCDVLVHFTRKPEAFGRVIIEAMACGCGVIASDNGGLPEIVEDGETGLIVQSPAELTDAIVRMATDCALREQYSRAARVSAERYRDVRVAERVMAIYDQIFDARGGNGQAGVSPDRLGEAGAATDGRPKV